MTRFRYRLARWLVGPFFRLTETGSWMVHHDAETQFTFSVRVAEWKGSLTTTLAPLEYTTTEPVDFEAGRSHGTFSGTFA